MPNPSDFATAFTRELTAQKNGAKSHEDIGNVRDLVAYAFRRLQRAGGTK
jgi:hypothetical protein